MGEVRIVTLDPERWAEFRELRLQALRGDPTAFGSSYEESVEEPEAFWRGRLEDAQRKVENITLFAEADGRLVGMMGMFRRFRIKTKHVATVFGVYVDPAARGRGIARQLMQALLDEIACLPEIVKLELTVNTENQPPYVLTAPHIILATDAPATETLLRTGPDTASQAEGLRLPG